MPVILGEIKNRHGKAKFDQLSILLDYWEKLSIVLGKHTHYFKWSDQAGPS